MISKEKRKNLLNNFYNFKINNRISVLRDVNLSRFLNMERFIESNQLFTYSTANILQKTHPQSVKCTSHALKAFPRTMI